MKKIDIVITWVDGSDQEWLKLRSNHYPQYTVASNQYRDWGLLKYWFRGIDQFAPWVNKIYFVTWGHVPSFLDTNHPKIKIVKHEDYIPDEYLPTFSSHPIEMNLHRIEGLSEQFIYFNDDMYLINETSPTDFFKDGKARDIAVLNPISPASYDSIAGIMLNNIAVINQNFNVRSVIRKNPLSWFNFNYGALNILNLLFLPWKRAVGLYQQHLPSSLFKSTYSEVWEREFEILDNTCKNGIRDVKRDVNQWLFKEWLVMKNEFIPRTKKFGKYMMVTNIRDIDKVSKTVLSKKTKTICINDHVEENIDLVMSELISVFETKFPNKSSFEL